MDTEVSTQILSNPTVANSDSLENQMNMPKLWVGILAAAWLMLPALQYFCTYNRTSLQISGTAIAPQLARIDLTPVYSLLVLCTLVAVIGSRYTKQGAE